MDHVSIRRPTGIGSKLTRAGISLNQLRDLIEQYRYLIVLHSRSSDCDLTAISIQYLIGRSLDEKSLYDRSLDDPDLERLQRFLRLCRRLDWTMPELDSLTPTRRLITRGSFSASMVSSW